MNSILCARHGNSGICTPGPHRAHDPAGTSESEQAKMCVLRAEEEHGGEGGLGSKQERALLAGRSGACFSGSTVYTEKCSRGGVSCWGRGDRMCQAGGTRGREGHWRGWSPGVTAGKPRPADRGGTVPWRLVVVIFPLSPATEMQPVCHL